MAKFVSVLISLIFILMSFLFLNIVPKVIDSHQAQCTESVEAVIADIDESEDISNNTTTYAPVYEYTFEGESFRNKSNIYTSIKPEIGRQVELLVDPENPEVCADPKLNDFTKTVFKYVGIVLSVISVVMVIVTIVIIVKVK